MTALAPLVFLSLSASQSPVQEPNIPLNGICGTVVYSHKLPQKNPAKPDRYKTTSMRGVPVLLYPREEGVACCRDRSPIASLETGRSGRFAFKGVTAGKFWLIVRANGHDAMTAIRYEPMKEFRTLCSDYTFELDDAGELQVGVAVMVD